MKQVLPKGMPLVTPCCGDGPHNCICSRLVLQPSQASAACSLPRSHIYMQEAFYAASWLPIATSEFDPLLAKLQLLSTVEIQPRPLPFNADHIGCPASECVTIQTEVHKMLTKGIIEPSSSHWASPLVLLKKKDGTWSFCTDYRLSFTTH